MSVIRNITGDITKGQVLRYMFMPQVLPRLGAFYTTGFVNLAYLIALVYRAVNILPQNHYVLARENRSKIGLRMVLAAAAAELKFTRTHIDQVIIYFVILLGMILLVGQFFMLLGFMMMNPAFAGAVPTTYAGFFAQPSYGTDIAYRILYAVFGVPELFNPGGAVRSFHTALYAMFQLYSVGLLVVGVIIVCYYIFAVVVETAQTGVPFGKRYNHVWTPIRLVFGLGLLIPIGFGLNSAQWITLYAAKFGSDFATRGWIIFNDVMTDAYLDNPQQRVGRPQAPELSRIVAFMMTVKACEYAYETLYNGGGVNGKQIDAYLVRNTANGGAAITMGGSDYGAAQQMFNNGDILIRFGEFNATLFTKYLGDTYPYCGDLVLFANDIDQASSPGGYAMQEFYYNMILEMFYADRYEVQTHGVNFIRKYTDQINIREIDAALPPAGYKSAIAQQLMNDTDQAITDAVALQAASPTWAKDNAQIQALGWGGAGIWYNKIAQINGTLVTSTNNIPSPKAMPAVMEYVKREQLQQNSKVATPFKITLSDGREIQFNSEFDKTTGKALSIIYDYWSREDTRQDALGNQVKQTNNVFIDVINAIFGTRGLFDMCANAEVHPLAQLSILGKGLIEASIKNLGAAIGLGAINMMPIPFIGAIAGAASSMLLSVVSITITMGFILFYVLPFMPFLYFFFAVGGWIKGLFEAMVGVPLWALAHLRIDGEGLPGDGAMSGYYLIFEIFLRPILILFGLLASVIIFASMVKVLNEIYALVVVNLSGHDSSTGNQQFTCGAAIGAGGGGGGGGQQTIAYFRGPIDELFFTIIYAIIVYMIGMSCFKLIDLVPNNILRYMGANVGTFNDTASDPADGLLGRLSIGTKAVTGQILGIGGQGASALGNIGKAGAQFMSSAPKQ